MHKGFKEPGGLMWRVEPMCTVLKDHYGVALSPSGYYAFKKRMPSARSLRDEELKEKIVQIYKENLECYGVRKIWHALLNEGTGVGRERVARLMRQLGLKGARRLKAVRTTIAGKNAKSAEDLIRRNFHADAPNRVWVADFTYVSTWEGWCYVAFIIDVFARRVIGYDVSVRMNKAMVARAFNMAVWMRACEGHDDLSGLIHHNDKGSQYTAEGFVNLLALYGIRASIGTVGDSYDNALAESMNGSYKAELVWNKGPWRSYEELNRATAEWVCWHNESCITEYNGYRSAAYIEEKWYSEKVDLRKRRKVS
ncbi:MAG: IS3 family transposase [Coriobacteriales bacterium]|jgi:putative transposase|nr:IS3 family transposase [Coriobacteriales bacterium]